MFFSERACSGVKRNNELLTTPHIPARKFSQLRFSSKKKTLFCSKKSTLYLFRTEEIVIPLLPKRGYYSIIPKQKFSYSQSNIPVQSPNMYYWQQSTKYSAFHGLQNEKNVIQANLGSSELKENNSNNNNNTALK